MDAKPYLVIARKYRPQTFDEVVGQDHIVTTLKNALSLNRLGHAYLFTGPRGVGKTSMARIFAKSLNCQKGPTADPCGKCQACQEIEGSRYLDVLEIDGASNRGIDEIRALRENVKFAPASGKFKVYIIDEVHQITADAFNALLKTLEEPPKHVKFVFATTASQKVPATILSRCQRFDFRRMTTDVIAQSLKEICRKEKIKIDEEALSMIAKAADGSLRDSQSLLDQIASMADDKITRRTVIQSLGSLEEEKLLELMETLARKDAPAALRLLDGVLKEGKDPALFLEKFLEHVRNLLFIKTSPDLADLIDATESYKEALLKQIASFSREDLFYFFGVIAHAFQTIKRFEMKRIPIEMALIKLAQGTPMEDLSKVLESLKDGEKKNNAAVPAKTARVSVTKPEPVRTEEDEEDPAEDEELPDGDLSVRDVLAEKKSASLESVWEPLIRGLKLEKISVATYLEEGEPGSFEGGLARISFPERLSFHRESLESSDNKKLIEKHLSSLLDQPVRVEFESVKELAGKPVSPSSEPAAPPPPPAAAEPSESVKSAMNIFGGRIVRS